MHITTQQKHQYIFNKEMDLELKRVYQKEYEKTHTREEFIKLIGKSYL